MTNEDNQELVNKNVNLDDITFPITLNTVIEENLNTVFYWKNIVILNKI